MASRASGELDLGQGRVARLRHLLLLLQCAGPRLLEPGEACVLQFGQRQRGPRRLDSGAGLVDALLDLVAGQLQRFLSLGSVGLGGGERPPGDLDLDRHLLANPVQVGTLAGQLGQSRVELGPRHVDLVAVRDRVDLRDHLPFLDAIILLDQKPDDPAGDQLRGDVDDVGLDKGVVGDRVRAPVADPAHRKRQADGEERDQQDDREDNVRGETDCGDRRVEPTWPWPRLCYLGLQETAPFGSHSWVAPHASIVTPANDAWRLESSASGQPPSHIRGGPSRSGNCTEHSGNSAGHGSTRPARRQSPWTWPHPRGAVIRTSR